MDDSLVFIIKQIAACVSPCPDSLHTSVLQTLINLFSFNLSTQPNKHHNFQLPVFQCQNAENGSAKQERRTV